MTTKDIVINLRNADPTIPNIRLAEIAGVTKARIRAILIDFGLNTKVYKNHCIICGDPNLTNGKTCSEECRQKLFFTEHQCEWCKKSIVKNKKQLERETRKYSHLFCSYSCRHKWYWTNQPEQYLENRNAQKKN